MKKSLLFIILIFACLSFVSGEVNCSEGEKYISQKMGSCDMAQDDESNGMCVDENATGCVFAIPGGAKPSCWLDNQAASYNNLVYYYEEGGVMGSDTPYFSPYTRTWTNYHADWYSCVCVGGVWEEAGDSSQEMCEAGIGVAKTLTFIEPLPENKWMNDFCCGDDCFEFYVEGEDGSSACCVSYDKVVVEGKCYDDIHDVEVEIIEAPSNASAEQEVVVKTKVRNRGVHDEEVEVEFSVEDEEEEDEEKKVIHTETKTISLSRDETKDVNFVWKALEGIYNFFVRAEITDSVIEEEIIDNVDSSHIEVSGVVYLCSDSDGGKNYFEVGKASLQVSPTRIRSYKDSCKNEKTDFLGDFDNNVGPGGGPVVKNKVAPYLYEAICKSGKPSITIYKCDCYNGKCIH